MAQLAGPLNLYVYRISDHEYSAGFSREGCEQRGAIVECWPLHTPQHAKFVEGHGTSYLGASEQVCKLAAAARELLLIDQTLNRGPSEPGEPYRHTFMQRLRYLIHGELPWS